MAALTFRSPFPAVTLVLLVPLLLLLQLLAPASAAPAKQQSGGGEGGGIPALREQWVNPSDILSVLLLIGGDIVQKALAQLAGGRVVPVAFSFGWVAYAFGSLMSIFGDGKLMPPAPDCPSIVVNARSGYIRANNSWVLGRVLRDFEARRETAGAGVAFSATVYRARPGSGAPVRDWVWYGGLVTVTAQCCIAAVPLVVYRDWTVLFVTVAGNVLAMGGGALPQWRAEKWSCRRNATKTVSLTRGNGFRHVMVIHGNGVGLDLEDLAAVRAPVLRHTKPLVGLFAVLWILFLITVAGLTSHTWFLLGIGCLGMLQNVVAAAASRQPEAFGIPLEKLAVLEGRKVMAVLQDLETTYPGVGASLLPVYFPGILREDEQVWWQARHRVNEKPKFHGAETV